MTRMSRKSAVPLEEVLRQMLQSSPIGREHKLYRIYQAWDDASGAGPYTLRRFWRDGKLYITLSSSVVRTQLMMQQDLLREKVNARRVADPLFYWDEAAGDVVKELILK